MAQKLDIHSFLKEKGGKNLNVVDVRSPKEFQKGHLPGAVNIPLFSNEERAIVGTLYKQEGKEQAFLEGLGMVGPKMRAFVEEGNAIACEKQFLAYCWRGGMRSSSMAWLWNAAGLKVHTLEGGYKAFRHNVLSFMANPFKLFVLGGSTGSGKTDILHELAALGEQVLDLEGLANHKGSSFGAIGEDAQPSTEHFENLIWSRLSRMDVQKPIWVEDESVHIGKVLIPNAFFSQMKEAPLFVVDLAMEARLSHLVDVYTGFEDDLLVQSIKRITKRLGSQSAKEAELAIGQKNYSKAARICLTYYDKTYAYGIAQKSKHLVGKLSLSKHDPKNSARKLLNLAYQKQPQ